ncbi:PP2C family serine/threonine-protein phosphatase [Gynurincola endophyticus]|uniref:PP2C family serine/threonine-protein phosphatase n=1 Tax=Gynurincola endophyticus TaxID=2479004 RepID=UPI000F8C8FB0|nr:PP2C family serine/threonine-protein phosphatase [Gynurincola endophyticus]
MEIFLKNLLEENNIDPAKIASDTFLKLTENARIADLSRSITDKKKQIIDIVNIYKDKEEFKNSRIVMDNASAKKEYVYTFDLTPYPNIVIKEIKNIDSIGLNFDAEAVSVYGVPLLANSVELYLSFYNKNDENQSEDIKTVTLLVNADPKDLWNNIPSDKNLRYAKGDMECFVGSFLDRKIVIASTRGRSHAHEGLSRDDHFCSKDLLNGWSIISVADGAGSAKYAREGSRIATESIVELFNNETILLELDHLIHLYFSDSNHEDLSIKTDNPFDTGEDTLEKEKIKIKSSIINILYKSVRSLHTLLSDYAKQESISIKDLNTTLIFTLIKKFDFGYAVLSFGVGDCPINVISKDFNEVKLLNMLDVGEFGGGTRFITMPEIFNNPSMSSRFAIHKFQDFSKIFLMTDGIYDAKFVTENKLEDLDTWKAFMDDLNGINEDQFKVDFDNDINIEIDLLKWMDFWSKGNHDDRTLAIIY